MTDTHQSQEDRPLVTFAVFAYNQEQYIREAVEGAFAQTYEPLEIILSDDCSSDRTFEIMQEMAAAYDGPHEVKVRQNEFNLGTALHVYSAFIQSKGALLLVAAGDDISFPERAETLSAVWDRSGRPSGVVHSGWETFRDHDGKLLGRFPAKRSAYQGNVLQDYAHSQWLPAAAPSAAYTRDVFDRFAPLFGGSIIEDAPLFFRAALIGRFVSTDQILVRLRSHESNTGTVHSINEPARWNRFAQSKIIAFRNMQSDLANWKGSIDPNLRIRIERRILGVSNSGSFFLLPQTERLATFAKARLAICMLFTPFVASRFRVRMEFILTFFGYNFHLHIKKKLHTLLKMSVKTS